MKRAIFLVHLCLLLCIAAAGASDIASTKHNLAVTGLDSMSRICVFCHTPHNANPAAPIWNRADPNPVYQPYFSTTLQAQAGQPTGSSKLCLSCHDGTIALGQVYNPDPAIAPGNPIQGTADLDTDLSDDHPISFVYDSSLAGSDTELLDPAVLAQGPVQLDSQGQLQCTSCHDPHWAPNPKFLVVDNISSGLCVACHDKTGWPVSSHATSTATWNGSGINPWPHSDYTTVGTNACLSCHASHAAGSPVRLMTFLSEEDNCLSCHNGNVAGQDLTADFAKSYRHPITSYSGVHDPTEDVLVMSRHVECQDCHSPHQSTAAAASAPNASGSLKGAAGVTLSGLPVTEAQNQYEVCFRCHADNGNVPPPTITRDIQQPNLRLKLDLGNPSFHPVAGLGQNSDVPSLITPWTETSIVYCTDCHASENGPGTNGTGPAGSHGSSWPFLLEREYRTAQGTQESPQAYALCYKCHDRNSILDDQSFAEHRRHIEQEDTPCSVCHDPHGISAIQGSAASNSHLINFDVSVVFPDPRSGLLFFEDLGYRTGQCYLECHGKRHDPEDY